MVAPNSLICSSSVQHRLIHRKIKARVGHSMNKKAQRAMIASAESFVIVECEDVFQGSSQCQD